MARIEPSRWTREDIYLEYDFEDVRFRWDFPQQCAYRKFLGEMHEIAVPHDNRLFSDARNYGDEIDAATYDSPVSP